jgi:hypothetical protein
MVVGVVGNMMRKVSDARRAVGLRETLTVVLGAVHVFYGAMRAMGHEFETYRFTDVLALDAPYQALFGMLELALGVLLVLRWETVSALLLGAMLNLALFVASMGREGLEPRRAAMRAVAWLVLHFGAVLLERQPR